MTHFWEPLAERNPVPGDPFATQALATHLAERAAVIDDVTRALRRIDTGDMKSAGVEELVRRRDELVPDLNLLERRYDEAAAALRPFCQVMEQAQSMARDALAAAKDAEDGIRQSRRGIEQMEEANARHIVEALNPVAQVAPPEPWTGPDWNRLLDDEEAKMAAARRLLDEAVELWEKAAGRCATRIDDAAHDDLRNDDSLLGRAGRFVGGIDDWVVDHFDSLADISTSLSAISGGLGLLALIPPLTPLAGAAAVVGAVTLVLDSHLAFTGQGGWGDVALGAVGLATFGVGRAYAAAARGTAGAAAAREAQFLRSTVGRSGILTAARGYVEVADDGTRLYSGAAVRSFRLKLFGEAVTELGTEAATGALPSARNWASGIWRWGDLDVPARRILDLSPRAVRYAQVAHVAEGIDRVLLAHDATEGLDRPVQRADGSSQTCGTTDRDR